MKTEKRLQTMHRANCLLICFRLGTLSYGQSKPSRIIESIAPSGIGENWKVRIEQSSAGVSKYFIKPNGEKVNVREYMTGLIEADREKFGSMSARLYSRINNLGDEGKVPVKIRIASPAVEYKLREDEAIGKRNSIHDRLSSKLFSEFGLAFNHTDLGESNWILNGQISKRDLISIKSLEDIGEIELDEPLLQVSGGKVSKTFADAFGGLTPTSIDINILSDNGYRGNGGGPVGVLEWLPMLSGDQVTYFNFPAGVFNVRPGTPTRAADSHARLVTSLIANTNGVNSFNFEKGGAWESNSILSATAVNGEQAMDNAYNWLTASNGAKVVNHSWIYYPWTSPADQRAQNTYDRLTDIAATTSPYVLNVMGAGNDQDSHPVPWNCHSCLVVGAVDEFGNHALFSSWKNGSTSDEVPHVMGLGYNIVFPDGQMQSGTSFSTPIISALALDLKSKYSHFNYYPECLKATLLAAAAGRNVGESYSSNKDTQSGFGIPDGYVADKVAANRLSAYNSSVLSGTQGVADFSFPSSWGSGTSMTFTITVNSPNSYIHFIITWFSNPDGTCTSGNTCWSDDLDLFVKDPHYWYSSISFPNTIERDVIFQGSGPATYTVQIVLQQRVTNKPIFGAISWVPVSTSVPIP